MLKGFSAVHGFIDPIAPAAGVAVGRFARADPEDIGVRLVYSDGTDGAVAIFVKNGLPGNPPIRGFEYPARGRCHDDVPIVAVQRIYGSDAPHHVGRADVAPAKGR